jgi:hypothetical protein
VDTRPPAFTVIRRRPRKISVEYSHDEVPKTGYYRFIYRQTTLPAGDCYDFAVHTRDHRNVSHDIPLNYYYPHFFSASRPGSLVGCWNSCSRRRRLFANRVSSKVEEPVSRSDGRQEHGKQELRHRPPLAWGKPLPTERNGKPELRQRLRQTGCCSCLILTRGYPEAPQFTMGLGNDLLVDGGTSQTM